MHVAYGALPFTKESVKTFFLSVHGEKVEEYDHVDYNPCETFSIVRPCKQFSA